ncbi:ribosomal L1 domain-containing protein [Neorickettsia findlayensis]|uniref:Ribosomal protein n=1 Tax=Neorickettsia findlayensis TaxID=2686014 RepID=A0A6P1GC29_9RICK|nr:ribosomal L1 domain-containing protein [Neorickettsia findlayensis]QHD65351.1 50S ribosomal protein L1 [Neorickettsia findlayensis]
MREMISADDALKKLVGKACKFNESVDVAVHFSSKDSVKVGCVFRHPFYFGRILVFCGEPQMAELLDENVTYGGEDLIETIKAKKNFVKGYKYSLATPSMMAKLSKIARILGPRGLMPDSKYGLVTHDVAAAVAAILGGKALFKTNKAGVMHSKIGNLGMGLDKLRENLQVFCESVFATRPKNVGLQGYVRSISVSSTMGDGCFVDFLAL